MMTISSDTGHLREKCSEIFFGEVGMGIEILKKISSLTVTTP